jgi:hypothetical protein
MTDMPENSVASIFRVEELSERNRWVIEERQGQDRSVGNNID